MLSDYPLLSETPSEDPAQRTRWNVRDSDATLLLGAGETDSPGAALTVALARELGRPLAVLDLLSDVARPVGFRLPPARILNVAGPRESEAPGIYALSLELLERVLIDGYCR